MAMAIDPEKLTITINERDNISALLYAAQKDRAGTTLILGHGAGANQLHPFMRLFASGLAERGFDVFTFNFQYMEQGRRVPDPKAKLESYRPRYYASHRQRYCPSRRRYFSSYGRRSCSVSFPRLPTSSAWQTRTTSRRALVANQITYAFRPRLTRCFRHARRTPRHDQETPPARNSPHRRRRRPFFESSEERWRIRSIPGSNICLSVGRDCRVASSEITLTAAEK